jgi:hypothetical protein
MRLAKTHAIIMSSLANQMPTFMGKATKQQKLLDNLPAEFQKIATQFRIPVTDFPHVAKFRAVLKVLDLSKYPKNCTKLIAKLDASMSSEIPSLMKLIKHPDLESYENNPFNPFSSGGNLSQWRITSSEKERCREKFNMLNLTKDKLGGGEAKNVLSATGLPRDLLFKVWELADIDKDGSLDLDEYCVAMHLIDDFLHNSTPLPTELDFDLIPPHKR